MRRYAIIQNERVHRVAELTDDIDIRSIYHSDIEVVEVTDIDAQERDQVIRQVAFERADTSLTMLERKLSKANLAKFIEGVAEGLIAIRDQQSQITFPAITLNVLSKYEALKE